MATSDGPKPFRVLLQQYRAAAGLSQAELAERASLSRRGISDLERGARRSPQPATVRRLAEALNLADPERAALLVSARSAPGLQVAPVGVDAHSTRHNLPVQWASFIGREQEVVQIQALVGSSRLLTLTGPGGIGKTRLAVEAAAAVLDRFEHGVCFVALGSISDPLLVARTIAQTLGVRVAGKRAASRELEELSARSAPAARPRQLRAGARRRVRDR